MGLPAVLCINELCRACTSCAVRVPAVPCVNQLRSRVPAEQSCISCAVVYQLSSRVPAVPCVYQLRSRVPAVLCVYQLYCRVPAVLSCTSCTVVYQLYSRVSAVQSCISYTVVYQLYSRVPAVQSCISYIVVYQLYSRVPVVQSCTSCVYIRFTVRVYQLCCMLCRRAYQLSRSQLCSILEEQQLSGAVLELVPESSVKEELRSALAASSTGGQMLGTLEAHLGDMGRGKVGGKGVLKGLSKNVLLSRDEISALMSVCCLSVTCCTNPPPPSGGLQEGTAAAAAARNCPPTLVSTTRH